LVLPRFELDGKIWRPGWLGNVVVGAVAAIVASGIFGAASSIDVSAFFVPDPVPPAGVQAAPLRLPPVPLGQLLLLVLVGFSGGRYLTVLSDKQLETITRNYLADALKAATANRQP